jgi:hypothetical protein
MEESCWHRSGVTSLGAEAASRACRAEGCNRSAFQWMKTEYFNVKTDKALSFLPRDILKLK